ncbi:MAG: leucine--tRNA ligase [Phycisphaerales bacterium]|nr:leucine--tRNA ligase [Phycisphaerales bacterium]
MTDEYRFSEIEPKWQAAWEKDGAFNTPNPGQPGFDASRQKFYCLDMFPYPSGAGLHVGHPEGYTATDIICRYKRMRGLNVLHPMGWDAFGLPAEQYAIRTGVHPSITTREAIDNFRRQLQRFGFSYDWSREFGTIDDDYYRWTQWIFLRIYNAWYDTNARRARPIAELIDELQSGRRLACGNPDGSEPVRRDSGEQQQRRWSELSELEQRKIIDSYRLAYVGEQTVNWCPKLGTALANEEVIDGKSERGGFPVFRKPMRQWMFRITAYGERLLDDLTLVDWPESTKKRQIDWIGRSDGAEIDFPLSGVADCSALRVFTTRPDTIFGATYMVVAPEHALVEALLKHPLPDTDVPRLRDYVAAARNRSDLERKESREKTGVFIGAYATNPFTKQRIPVWTADYVLAGYGTGAIMAVPAHDERDFEFAAAFDLPIRDVVYPRPVLAMRYYAENAQPEEAEGSAWIDVMADFMGLTVTSDCPLDQFAGQLRVVRARRAEHPQTPQSPADPAPATAVNRRGSIHMTWRDAIESMNFVDFADMAATLHHGGYYARLGRAYSGNGHAVNSSGPDISIDGLLTEFAKNAVIKHAETSGIGAARTQFKLRDWLFSRQRYWGEPFPIVWDERGHHHAVAESCLPVRLPEMADYAPEESDDPRPLLAKAAAWVNTTAGDAGVRGLPAGAAVRRETNTMPGWAGSCWYYIRFADPKNNERFVGRAAEQYWLRDGVDLYIGGEEHAVLHLLYARFWHKVLFDLGEVSTPEPFRKLFHQGLITSFAYQRADRSLVPMDEVDTPRDGEFIERATGQPVRQIIAKMSKSLKNVINPDDIIASYGADTFRLYEMGMGPLEASKPWNTRDIIGPHRFLQRVWRLVVTQDEDSPDGWRLNPRIAQARNDSVERLLHKTIKKVQNDIESFSFHTAISQMIVFSNEAPKPDSIGRDQIERLLVVLAPFAPHITEELWQRLGHADSVHAQPWPAYDETLTRDATVEVLVQVNGKKRGHLLVAPDAADHDVIDAAQALEAVAKEIAGRPIKKSFVAKGRLVNLIV